MRRFMPVEMPVIFICFFIICSLCLWGLKSKGPTNKSFENGVPVQSDAI